MKRFFSICIAAALTLGFVACETPQDENKPNNEQGSENNGENNGDEQQKASVIGSWRNISQTTDYVRTQTYTFNEDLSGKYENVLQPLASEDGGGMNGATATTYNITYEYDAEAQQLITYETIPGMSVALSMTYTAIIEGETLSMTLTATSSPYPSPDMDKTVIFNRYIPEENTEE